jgi:predicted  nucleic acid-binding Zn-ribbon protein
MSIQYLGGPSNVAFDIQNTMAALKCRVDDLQTVVSQIQQTIQNINTRINALENPALT